MVNTLEPTSEIRTRVRDLRSSVLTSDFREISSRAAGLYRTGLRITVVAVIAGAAVLLENNPEYLLAFLAATIPMVIGLFMWANSSNQGLPIFPILLVQHGAIYGLPLIVENENLLFASVNTIQLAGMITGGFIAVCLAGWSIGKNGKIGSRSKGNFAIVGGKEGSSRCLKLAFALLGASLAFQLAGQTGLIWTLLPGGLASLFPILRTFSTAASMLGAMLGGLVVGARGAAGLAPIYWLCLGSSFLLLVSDVLISGASGLVLAATVGISLGKRRIPLGFLVITMGIVGFLNQGKFVMRERYWEDTNTTKIALSDLPAFYAEWIDASANYLFSGIQRTAMTDEFDDGGQSIFERVNNLQNLAFVIEAQENSRFLH